MVNATQFGRRLVKYEKELVRGASKALGEYSSGYYNELLDENVTPVLTGYARSRWVLTVGLNQIPSLSVPPERDARATYPSPSRKQLDLKKLQSVVISNNAPYIGILNKNRSILAKAKLRTEGTFDRLLKVYVPK